MNEQQDTIRAEVASLAQKNKRGRKPLYTEDQKLLIVKAHLTKQVELAQLEQIYGVSRVSIWRWITKFAGAETRPEASRPEASSAGPADDAIPTFKSFPSKTTVMAKKITEASAPSESEELDRLQAENRLLQEQLKMAQLMVHARDVMIEEAEKTFNIAIRKKSGAKQ